VTIGIGVICESGKYVILASDNRASYGDPLTPNDSSGKQWDFHPFKIAVSVAGRLGLAHNIISQLTIEMEKLLTLQEKGTTIVREHIENAVDRARAREMRRRYDSSSRINFGVTLQQLLRGKLPHGAIDKYAWQQICNIVFKQPLLVEMIVGGFLEDEPILLKASGRRELETDSDPPVFVIGSKGAAMAMDHLNNRGQHIFSGLPQSLLHIHEALDIARENDKFVGPCQAYVVMKHDLDGFGQIAHDASCVKAWAGSYSNRDNTDSLNNDISRKQAEMCMTRIEPGVRFKRKPPPKSSSRKAKWRRERDSIRLIFASHSKSESCAK